MSPEQARGELLDGRSDLYSLGVMLYHMVTGRLPFTADTALGCVTKHLTEPVPRPRVVCPDLDIPPILEEFILRTLSKKREHRPPTAAAFQEELGQIVEKVGRGEIAAPIPASTHDAIRAASRGGKRTGLLLVAALLVVVGAVVAVMVLRDRDGEAGGARSNGDPPAPMTPVAEAPRDAALRLSAMDAGVRVARIDAQATRSPDPPPRTTGRRRRRRRPVTMSTMTPAMQPRPKEPERPRASSFKEVYAKANAAFNAGSYGQAIRQFKKALRLRPGHANSIKRLGQCYLRQGRTCVALRYFRRYQRKVPGNFFINNHIKKLSPRCGGK
jgi:hypothetical protein